MIQMELADAAAIEDVLRAQLGRAARLRRYDRTLDSPMNFVLARAERQLKMPFAVYWVDDSFPDVFCLRGFSLPVAVFSSRYVEVWGDIRAALTGNVFGPDLLPQLGERLSLRLIAELSLSQDDPEFAASMMLRSTIAGDGLSHIANTIASLEQEPIGTPYMACWFYGLAHELGHFAARYSEGGQHAIRDEDILASVEETLNRWNLPEDFREEARSNARSGRSGYILGVHNLRDEGFADIFATSVLLESTVEILRVVAEGVEDPESAPSFDIVAFISEMVLSLNVVAMFDRCRRTAMHASTAAPRHEDAMDALLHPVAVSVRLGMVRWYLEMASAHYVFGDAPTPDEHRRISATVDAVMDGLRPAIDAIETGLASAMRTALDRQRRGSFVATLQQWRKTIGADRVSAATESIEIERFCTLAASMGRTSPIFEAMLTSARNPSADVELKLAGTSYFCPWVDGPGEFSVPFGLQTRHGYLVFVFVTDGALYKQFRDISAEVLVEGYTMT